MAEYLRAAAVVSSVIAGWALLAYAGYLYYVALPDEHSASHLAARAALVLVGLALVLLGTRLLL